VGTDLGGWLELARNEAGGYFDWFLNALRSPSFVGRQALQWSGEPEAAGDGNRRFAPLVSILAISIFVGATIGATIPHRPQMKDRVTVAVVVMVLWIFVSLIAHALIRAAGGVGSMKATLFTMLQILAFAYVVSNALAWFGIAALEAMGKTGYVQSGSLIIALQFLILLIYLPLSLREVHHVGAGGALAGTFAGTLLALSVPIVSAVIAMLFGWITLASGGCGVVLGVSPRLVPPGPERAIEASAPFLLGR
jgi:hypothetical protein